MAITDDKMKQLAAKYGLKAATEFQIKLFELVIGAEDSDSRYNAFVELSRSRLPNNVSEVYGELKKRDYRMCDEDDINVYVDRVASRHLKKFEWMFASLFKAYPKQLQAKIDLVIWGCGCGLDLLALYDEALKQGASKFWTVVRNITLIDISEVALKRANEIAEVLFPLSDKIKTVQCNLMDSSAVESIGLPCRAIESTRIHILSNIIDIIRSPEDFSRSIRKISGREGGYNEIFVALAPGDQSGVVGNKMRLFQKGWSGLAEPAKTETNRPFGCEYVFFECNTLKDDVVYSAYLDRPIIGRVLELLHTYSEKYQLWELISDLLRFTIIADGNKKISFLSVYTNVRLMKLGRIDCLVFATNEKLGKYKVCIVVIGDVEKSRAVVVKNWILQCGERVSDDRIRSCYISFSSKKGACSDRNLWREAFDLVVVVGWGYTDRKPALHYSDGDQKYGVKWVSSRSIDVSGFFCTDICGARILEEPKYNQKDVVYGRKQLRMIRGGPGTGKTFTMLSRAKRILEWRHLPILVLCKTNTLVEANRRRLLATLRNQEDIFDDMIEENVEFSTVANYLCRVFRCSQDCLRQLKPEHKDLPQPKTEHICEKCFAENLQKIFAGNFSMEAINCMHSFGAVLMDEAQNINTSELQAIFLLTGRGNPWRDFYVFCDEEQTFRGADALVDDVNTKRKVVRAPAVGFGHFITLKKNYRTYHPKLVALYREFQKLMSKKYDVDSLLMEELIDEQGTLNIARPFVIKRGEQLSRYPSNLDFGVVAEDVNHVINEIGQKTIVIICDDVPIIRQWYNEAHEKEWVLTHTSIEDKIAERELRMSFEECDGSIHLTSVDCAQGRTFSNVLYIVTKDWDRIGVDAAEMTFTGITRARYNLRIIDYSPSGWLFKCLKKFNDK